MTHFNSTAWTRGTIWFSCSLAENTCPVLTANILSSKCLSRCCEVSREPGAYRARNIYWTGSEGNDMGRLPSWQITFCIQVEARACFLPRNTFSNLSDFLERPDWVFLLLNACCQSQRTPVFVKQSNFLTGNRNTPESFICVCFAIIHGDQRPCLGPQCQRETSMTSPIHTASSPHISHALSRHIPQQRETPRVTIHQTKPFMAHQKTMNCQSERSVCNMKWQRILQTQIKQWEKWENYIMFG